jgi:prevent-host-death family protein
MPKSMITKSPAGKRKAPPRKTKSGTPWTVADAKAHLSTVLEKARTDGPQTITRNGKEAAVVVGIEEWERKTKRKGTLADFLLNSPLRASEIDLERVSCEPRDVEL